MTTNAGHTIEMVAQQILDISAAEGKLPAERVLAEQLGVNRYVLRKALRLLRASAEIPASRPRSNAARSQPSRKRSIANMTSPAECWEVRLSLEPEIARLAAVRGTPAEIQMIEAAHAKSDPLVFDLDIDIEFHRAIAVASHNMLALHLIEQVMEITRDPGFRAKFPAFTAETGWRHHDMIVEAIRNRHASDAESAMRTHLTAILQWLNGGGEPARVPPK
ncbi:FadR/GntR family transcriptional regulator [Neorhizobium petrolearium]|uniref:FadR/GntR family transcriptional regulator n=1 Tax=Neorhizobium petrolearium TaxID=515361 RepID=UPI003F15BF41